MNKRTAVTGEGQYGASIPQSLNQSIKPTQRAACAYIYGKDVVASSESTAQRTSAIPGYLINETTVTGIRELEMVVGVLKRMIALSTNDTPLTIRKLETFFANESEV